MKNVLVILITLSLFIFGVSSVMAQGYVNCPNYQSGLRDGTGRKSCQNYEGGECFCGVTDYQRPHKNIINKGQGCTGGGKGINCCNKQFCI